MTTADAQLYMNETAQKTVKHARRLIKRPLVSDEAERAAPPRMLPSVIGGPGGCLAFIAQTIIALADLPSGCRAWAALPDCNSRDRSRILGADEHLLRGRVMAMKIDRIQPAGMNVRIQQGKPAYSHVVTVTGPGKTIYIAGQLARDAEGNIVGPGDMRAQLEQTFKNLDACLKAAGATWADVVKTNTFVTDYQAFSQCSDVRMRYFGVASPTSTTIQIGGLAQPEAMVEIEMIAVVE